MSPRATISHRESCDPGHLVYYNSSSSNIQSDVKKSWNTNAGCSLYTFDISWNEPRRLAVSATRCKVELNYSLKVDSIGRGVYVLGKANHTLWIVYVARGGDR